jgi:[ribosomal protein S5]-alanine N-acetyltransferase
MEEAIETERLSLVPFTHELTTAAMSDRVALARALAVELPSDWPAPEFGGILSVLAQVAREDATRAGLTRLIVHRADRVLIGDIGFMEPPDRKGTVEIGYSLIERYRRQGLATEAARGLIAWAVARRGVRRVVARCLDDNLPSIRLLEGIGMRRTGAKERTLHWELVCAG